MRFKIKLDLQHEVLDLDYRPIILSFIKNAFSQDNPDCYRMLYEGSTVQKLFAFAPYLPSPSFSKEMVKVGKLFLEILFTTPDYSLFINLYNAFLRQRFKPFPLKFNNFMTLKSIVMLPEKIIDKDSVMIKLLSPLVIRQHNKEDNQDKYLIYNQDNFEPVWRDTLNPLLSLLTDSKSIQDLTLKPFQCKKVVVTTFKQTIDTTLGTFQLSGDRSLLNYLFSLGMGSRRSQGFGVFDVIG